MIRESRLILLQLYFAFTPVPRNQNTLFVKLFVSALYIGYFSAIAYHQPNNLNYEEISLFPAHLFSGKRGT